jgi:Family of unknown function (DUF5908)
MSLEINEIGIKVQVRDSSEVAQRKAASTDGGCRDLDREQIVEDVVLRVLKVLKSLKER